MKLRKYSELQLREAVENSISLRQVLKKLRVAPYGGNYEVLKRAISHFGLDCSHFKGQGWNRGKIAGPRQPIGKFLSNELPIQSYKLRNRLLKEGLFSHRCANCGLTDSRICGFFVLTATRLLRPIEAKTSLPGLSSGLPSAQPVKASPNLTPVHPRVSPRGTQLSPLRLPDSATRALSRRIWRCFGNVNKTSERQWFRNGG